ncbi:MAG: hypothetical protein H0X33_04785 [Taibaiella sp.]|nr:hypothetical protein [Taibaiella sp.]
MNETTIPDTHTEKVHHYPKGLRIPAAIISYVLHPVFMPLFLTLLIYKLSPISFAGIQPHDFSKWIAIITLNTLFFPLVSVLLLKGLHFIKSIQMDDPKDRIIPLMATMIFYFWADNVISNIPNVPLVLHVLLLGSFWGIIAIFMVNIFFKVSMHTCAAGSMIGILIVLMIVSPTNLVIAFFIALIVAGIMGTVRLILGAHRYGEIWLGYIIGIVVMLGAYIYLK